MEIPVGDLRGPLARRHQPDIKNYPIYSWSEIISMDSTLNGVLDAADYSRIG